MQRFLPRTAAGYLIAVALVAATTALRYWLHPYFGDRVPLLLFALPVLVTALVAGVGPALVAICLSLLSGVYFFIDSDQGFVVQGADNRLRVAFFIAGSTIILGIVFLRERAKAALQANEVRFQSLVQSAHDVSVFFLGPDGTVQSWNEGAERIKGYKSEEILGKHISVFYTEEDVRNRVPWKFLDEAVAHGAARYEGWRVRKNGERFWADVSLSVIRDQSGEIRGFSKITYDRTREQSLLKSLEESEQTAKALLESTAQAVVGINAAGKIRLVNKTAEEIFGYTRREMVGEPLEMLLPEEIREHHVEERRNYFAHARPRPMGQGMDLSARHKSGKIFPIEASINMCDTPAGKMAVSFVTDITKRKQIENDLLVEQSQLKSILDYSPLLVSIKDLSGRIIIANQSLSEILGIPQKELIGKGVFDLLPPDVAKRIWQRDQDAMRSASPLREEERIRLKDGSSRVYATVRFPVSYINSLEPFGLCTFSLDITEQKEAEERALHAAQHDPLTDLPNRALIYEFGHQLLAAAARTGSKVAVMFFDLDRFKPINDTYGHEVGDKMLQAVASRISRSVRSSDLAGRLGGDEFVAILTNVESEKNVQQAAQHLLATLREPYHIEHLELRTSPSIGISLFPDDGQDIDRLLRCADAAMYHAKANGRNTYQFFNLEIDSGTKRVFALEQRLRHSFHESEFEVYYQPILSTHDLRVRGAEALIRWKQPGSSPVMPGDFIAAAEACGLINQLGSWVIEEACRQQVEWRGAGLPSLKIAVNVSPIQFRSHDFQERVARAISESGVAPAFLELEITESMLMREVERVTESLAMLKSLGLRISLDDFGTGYSSLSHLSQLPIDKLKIDQSFVRNMGSDHRSLVITETVIGMGKKLGLEVVAEGIESEQAFELLRERDCDLGQGYFFSPPLPAAQFAAWIRATEPDICH